MRVCGGRECLEECVWDDLVWGRSVPAYPPPHRTRRSSDTSPRVLVGEARRRRITYNLNDRSISPFSIVLLINITMPITRSLSSIVGVEINLPSNAEFTNACVSTPPKKNKVRRTTHARSRIVTGASAPTRAAAPAPAARRPSSPRRAPPGAATGAAAAMSRRRAAPRVGARASGGRVRHARQVGRVRGGASSAASRRTTSRRSAPPRAHAHLVRGVG